VPEKPPMMSSPQGAAVMGKAYIRLPTAASLARSKHGTWPLR
jgi:hypothetical protein